LNAFDLPTEFVVPDYQGRTIANVPGTVANLLGAPYSGLPPLAEPSLNDLSGRINKVIVLLVDSLGWDIFLRSSEHLSGFAKQAAVNTKITSVFPSTTVAALSSLWTGYAPAQHSVVGLRLFLPNEAVLSSVLRFSPTFATLPDSLTKAGIEPEKFLQVPGFAEQLAAAGIVTYSLKGQNIVNSSLSRMLDRGVKYVQGIVSAADMFVRLHEIVEHGEHERCYVNAYWPALDTICHARGPNHPAVNAELISTLSLFQNLFLDRLSPKTRGETAVIVTGDHGHIETPASHSIFIEEFPHIEEMLLMRPAGEPRAPYFYARQGCRDTLLESFNSAMQEELSAYSANTILTSGMLGPKPHAPQISRRLGDVVALMKSDYTLLTPKERDSSGRFIGRHGGMTAQEMEVPLLAFLP